MLPMTTAVLQLMEVAVSERVRMASLPSDQPHRASSMAKGQRRVVAAIRTASPAVLSSAVSVLSVLSAVLSALCLSYSAFAQSSPALTSVCLGAVH